MIKSWDTLAFKDGLEEGEPAKETDNVSQWGPAGLARLKAL